MEEETSGMTMIWRIRKSMKDLRWNQFASDVRSVAYGGGDNHKIFVENIDRFKRCSSCNAYTRKAEVEMRILWRGGGKAVVTREGVDGGEGGESLGFGEKD
ncbi:hypothetical protein AHAS_Ahas07G0120200 [Arachis hypogaea]